MAVLKPRQRLVYFRISEDEFHKFVALCEREGARSISDLARRAVHRLIAEGGRQRDEKELALRIDQLDKLIAEVKLQLQLLAAIQDCAPVLHPDLAAGCGNQSKTANLENQIVR
jgi:hypothetical protein